MKIHSFKDNIKICLTPHAHFPKSSPSLLFSVFQSVLNVLDSPNSWDAFRKAGGFTGLLSLVTDMEGALSDPPQGEPWKSLGHQLLLDLLLLILHILALAVHLHTVNAHHFETGGFYERLAEALLQLGCFYSEGPEKEKWDEEMVSCPKSVEDNQCCGKSFHQFVELAEAPAASPSTQPNLPFTLRTCIRLLSYLEQFATGTYSPQELHLGLEPEDECDGDNQHVHLGSEDKQGVSRRSTLSSSSLCTESFYRWVSHAHSYNMNL